MIHSDAERKINQTRIGLLKNVLESLKNGVVCSPDNEKDLSVWLEELESDEKEQEETLKHIKETLSKMDPKHFLADDDLEPGDVKVSGIDISTGNTVCSTIRKAKQILDMTCECGHKFEYTYEPKSPPKKDLAVRCPDCGEGLVYDDWWTGNGYDFSPEMNKKIKAERERVNGIEPRCVKGMNYSWNLNLFSGPKLYIECGRCGAGFHYRMPLKSNPRVACACGAVNRIPLSYG